MKNAIYTTLGLILLAALSASATSIVRTEVNKANILNIYKTLNEIKNHLIRIEDKL